MGSSGGLIPGALVAVTFRVLAAFLTEVAGFLTAAPGFLTARGGFLVGVLEYSK